MKSLHFEQNSESDVSGSTDSAKIDEPMSYELDEGEDIGNGGVYDEHSLARRPNYYCDTDRAIHCPDRVGRAST